MPESQAYINADGKGVIKFRLTEVSANHRKKPFCVLVCALLNDCNTQMRFRSLHNVLGWWRQVGPDREKSPLNSDIAPTISTPVIVRSKKPKVRMLPTTNKISLWSGNNLCPHTYRERTHKQSASGRERQRTQNRPRCECFIYILLPTRIIY